MERNSTEQRRWKEAFKGLWSKQTLTTLGLVAILLPVAVYATDTWHVFTPNTVVSSEEVNQNFAILDDRLATYEDAIVVDANKNVGVGVANPGSKLEVGGSIRSTSTDPVVALNGATGPNPRFWYLQVPTTYDGRFRIYDQTAGQERFSILPNGNVGIGTTVPQEKLHVHDSGTISLARFTDVSTGATGADGFAIGYDNAYGGVIWNREATSLVFATNNTEAMRILSGGNVGIGTTSPSTKLTVQGPSGDGSPLLSIGRADGPTFVVGTISGTVASYAPTGTAVVRVGSTQNGNSILTTGNIGIGMTSPQSRLAVASLPSAPPSGDTSGTRGSVCITNAGNMWVDDDGVNDCQ